MLQGMAHILLPCSCAALRTGRLFRLRCFGAPGRNSCNRLQAVYSFRQARSTSLLRGSSNSPGTGRKNERYHGAQAPPQHAAADHDPRGRPPRRRLHRHGEPHARLARGGEPGSARARVGGDQRDGLHAQRRGAKSARSADEDGARGGAEHRQSVLCGDPARHRRRAGRVRIRHHHRQPRQSDRRASRATSTSSSRAKSTGCCR